METRELGALAVGAVIAIVVTGIVCWFNGRIVRRQTAPSETTPRMHIPVVNPTPGWEQAHQSGPIQALDSRATQQITTAQAATTVEPLAPSETNETIKSLQLSVLSTQRDRDILVQETEHLRRQIRVLTNELQRVEHQSAQTETQWKTEQHRLAVSEAGLVTARREIDEIREFVLQLGATKSDEDIIDLRKS